MPGEQKQVWVGHSCPTIWNWIRCGKARQPPSQIPQPKAKSNFNGVGQECPTHTRLLLRDQILFAEEG